MSLRVITARVNGQSSDGSVLNGALSLSRLFSSHIDVLFTRPDPRIVVELDEGVYPGFYEEMIAAMERRWTEVANKALKTFEKWRSTNNIAAATKPGVDNTPSAEWRDEVGTDTQTMGKNGRVADLVVTAMPARRPGANNDLNFETALLDAGRPVLLVPAISHSAQMHSTVMIAWNGSAEAYRAVLAAMPILDAAEKVCIFIAAEGSVEPSMAQELVRYLAWHGIEATVLEADMEKNNSVEAALQAAIKRTKANLLVMGAYTHSRLKELLLGGVTRHVFQHATIPVFMAH